MSISSELISRLSPQQQAFVRAYIDNGGDAKAAAVAAGYKGKDAGSRVKARALPAIEAVYREAHEALAPKVAATKEWLLDDFMAQATAKLSDLYDENGRLKPIHDWPDVWQQGLVSSVKTKVVPEGDDYVEVLEVKLADRTRIRELIGKHVGVKAFSDVIELKKSLPVGEVLARRRKLQEQNSD